MKPNIIKAVAAIEQFFKYNMTPEDLSSLLGRLEAHNERDAAMRDSLIICLNKSSQE